MPEDRVGDHEVLYRSVAHGLVSVGPRGLQVSTAAFNDPGFKPSVDRADLRADPNECKREPTHGVLGLVAVHVRSIRGIANTNAEAGIDVPANYFVDVIPRPILLDNPKRLPHNPAHAQVETTPAMVSGSRFKKLKEALARMAERHGFVVTHSTS